MLLPSHTEIYMLHRLQGTCEQLEYRKASYEGHLCQRDSNFQTATYWPYRRRMWQSYQRVMFWGVAIRINLRINQSMRKSYNLTELKIQSML